MLAGQTAANSRTQQMQAPQDYTVKLGDFQMLLAPSLAVSYNDNINLAQTNVLNDFIVTPGIAITASYPLTQRNLLYLDVSVGYNWYTQNPRYSSFFLNSSSGTGLSFDIAIKNFTINLHNWVTYSQGVGQNGSATTASSSFVNNSQNGSIANAANYGTFQNTVGLAGIWDLDKANFSVGYDHQNVLATSGDFNQVNHSAELLFARGGLSVNRRVAVGLETTAAFTSYQENVLNDNNIYTVGPYIEFRPGSFFSVTARGGYSFSQFQNTSATIQTANQNSWYASLSISHQPTEWLKYSLDAGRSVQLGVVSDLLESWYVRPTITFSVIKGLNIDTFGFYESGNQGVGSVGNVPGNPNGTYNWYGGGLRIQHDLTSRFTLGLTYQITLRSSEVPNTSYTQNLVALQLTYHPKAK